MKTYVGIVRDHSASMRLLTQQALNDYNATIESISGEAKRYNQDVIISVVKCGVGPTARVERELVNSSVHFIRPITSYIADGTATPLFDSVGELIEIMRSVPDANTPGVAFLITAITDGYENYSTRWKHTLASTIRDLQGSDKWTFTFRVPRGHRSNLMQLGIPEGNIFEWEVSQRGLEIATVASNAGMNDYFQARAMGSLSTRSFYKTNASTIPIQDVKGMMQELALTDYQIFDVYQKTDISSFLTAALAPKPFKRGQGFYELMKPEKAVQDYKKIVVQDRSTNKVYTGQAARQLLGLPDSGTHKVVPGDHGKYRIFVQSGSLNRVLPEGTKVFWMENP